MSDIIAQMTGYRQAAFAAEPICSSPITLKIMATKKTTIKTV